MTTIDEGIKIKKESRYEEIASKEENLNDRIKKMGDETLELGLDDTPLMRNVNVIIEEKDNIIKLLKQTLDEIFEEK